MKREEFISALRSRLSRLPADELESALDYYNEIFLDAGEDKEEETAESLGSIDDIARQIYAENGIEPDGRPTFMMDEFKEQVNNDNASVRRNYNVSQPAPFSAGKLIAFILLFPIWFPLLIVFFVLLFVFFVVGFSIEIAVISSGVGLVIGGFSSLFSVPPVGVMCIGAGLILCGIFGLTFRYVFKGCIKMFVSGLNTLVGIMHKIFVGGESNV